MLETFFSGPDDDDLREYGNSRENNDLYDGVDNELEDANYDDDLEYEEDDMDDMEEIEDLDELDDLSDENGELFEEEDFEDDDDDEALETRKDIWSNMEWDKD